MTRRPRLLLFALLCLTPVLIGVTSRYGEGIWLVPAGLLPLLLLGPTRVLLWSGMTGVVFWVALRTYGSAIAEAEWQAKWRTVRGLALLSLIGIATVIAAFTMLTLGSGILALSWGGAAAIAWALHLLVLTRGLDGAPRGPVALLRLWLLATLLPSVYAFLFGTLAGLCC